MLEVSVNVNREVTVAQLHAVRRLPKTKTVKDGIICTYDIVYMNVTVGTLKGAYGCGVNLAIQLLEKYRDNKDMYKTIAMIKLTEDEKWKMK